VEEKIHYLQIPSPFKLVPEVTKNEREILRPASAVPVTENVIYLVVIPVPPSAVPFTKNITLVVVPSSDPSDLIIWGIQAPPTSESLKECENSSIGNGWFHMVENLTLFLHLTFLLFLPSFFNLRKRWKLSRCSWIPKLVTILILVLVMVN